MSSLLERYNKQISGVLSCFDRITITGTLPGVCYAFGMALFDAHESQIDVNERIFDTLNRIEGKVDRISLKVYA